MEHCEVCGNEYRRAFRVVTADRTDHVFDCFECAIHALAPRCAHCDCAIIGHGVERDGLDFCCAHCASEGSDEDAVDLMSEASFPASDAPGSSTSGAISPRR